MNSSFPPKNAFKEALDARANEIIRNIVADLQGDSKDLAALPESILERVVRGQVEQLFKALTANETPTRISSLSHLFERAIAKNVPPEALLGALQTVRRYLLDASLGLLATQIPGTLEGLRKLMHLLDESALVLHQASWAKARAVERETHLLKTLAELSPFGICIVDMQGVFTYANASAAAILGRNTLVGIKVSELDAPVDVPGAQLISQAIIKQGTWSGRLPCLRPDGTTFIAHLTVYLVRDERGVPIARCSLIRDMTEDDKAEAEKLALKEQIIESQQAMIQKLSTPLMPVAQGVVLLPLVGTVDSARVASTLDSLLQGISKQRARIAIVDVTGIDNLDRQVAETLVRMAGAVRLLGAEIVLTGIQPNLAHTLIDLNINFGDILVLGTLAAGLRYALSTASRPTHNPRP